jgi:hypothetical protein
VSPAAGSRGPAAAPAVATGNAAAAGTGGFPVASWVTPVEADAIWTRFTPVSLGAYRRGGGIRGRDGEGTASGAGAVDWPLAAPLPMAPAASINHQTDLKSLVILQDLLPPRGWPTRKVSHFRPAPPSSYASSS